MNQQKFVTNNKKYFYSLLKVAASFFGAAILFWSCENDIAKIKAFSAPEELPTLTAYNFETVSSDSGKVKYFLKAPELLRFESDGQPFLEFPQGIHIVKYNNKQEVISNITAGYAKQLINEKKWEAKINVIAINAQGDSLKTEQLFLDEKTENIYSEKFVQIFSKDRVINGIGFESDQNLTNWKIKNPTGTFYVEVQKNSQKKSDSITVSDDQENQKPIQF